MRSVSVLILTVSIGSAAWKGKLEQAAAYQQYFDERRVFEPIDMATDTVGNLWIATREGLLRFDGSQYLKVESPLPDIRRMCRAGDGSLWFGGGKGLARYEKGEFTIVSDESVAGLACTGGSTVYSANPKVRRWSADGAFTDFDAQANRELVAAEDDRIWFGCGTDVCALSGDRIRRVGVSNGQNWLGAVGTADGRMFASIRERLFEIEASGKLFSAKALPELAKPLRERQFAVLPGRKGVWTEGRDGIANLTEQLRRWLIPFGGALATVIYPSGAQGLWVGTIAAGIFHLDLSQPIERLDRDHELQGEIRTVLPMNEDGAVIGTSMGVWWNGGEGRRQKLFGSDIYSLIANGDGTFWAVSHGQGVLKFDRAGRVLAKVGDPDPDEFMMNDLRDIFRDVSGQIWVGGKTGLYRLEDTAQARLRTEPRLAKEYISEFQQDKRNTLWVTGEGELWRRSGSGFVAHAFDATLPSQKYRTLARISH